MRSYYVNKKRVSLVIILLITLIGVPYGETNNETLPLIESCEKIFIKPSLNFACTSIVVGRNATVDGSVLFGHNEDDDGEVVIRLHVIPRMKHRPRERIYLRNGGLVPQVKETYSYLWSEMPNFDFSDSYLNEYGVTIASDWSASREDCPELENGGIRYYLRRIVIERAKTAREGVKILGQLVEQYGYAHPGRTYIIADPKEAWIVCVVWGKHWVAQRVPDEEVVVVPNRYVIHEVNLEDKANFMGSQDLITYAVKRGWYNLSEPFDLARAYGNASVINDPSNTYRQWGGLLLFTGKNFPMDNLPFSAKPNRKLAVKDVMEVLRYHYEGTKYDPTKGYKLGSPHFTDVRTICSKTTQESFVMQLRSNMPDPIGNIYWRTAGRPCESVYTPWYLGILRFPKPYEIGEIDNMSMESAYWIFRTLTDWVEEDYEARIEELQTTWRRFEDMEFELQENIEKMALKLYYKKGESYARFFLTEYSGGLGMDVLYEAEKNIKTPLLVGKE